MNRSTASLMLIIVMLAFLLIVALIFPAVGEGVRGLVAALFQSRGGVADNVTATLIVTALLAVVGLLWRYGKGWWSALTGQNSGQSQETTVRPVAGAAAKTAVDEARSVARRVNEFVHERKLKDPFNTADLPTGTEAVWEPPEYKEVYARYSNHIDETLSQYGRNLLPDVVSARGALADEGITDAELDRVYSRPKNYDDIETVHLRLWDMAGRLSRKS